MVFRNAGVGADFYFDRYAHMMYLRPHGLKGVEQGKKLFQDIAKLRGVVQVSSALPRCENYGSNIVFAQWAYFKRVKIQLGR